MLLKLQNVDVYDESSWVPNDCALAKTSDQAAAESLWPKFDELAKVPFSTDLTENRYCDRKHAGNNKDIDCDNGNGNDNCNSLSSSNCNNIDIYNNSNNNSNSNKSAIQLNNNNNNNYIFCLYFRYWATIDI